MIKCNCGFKIGHPSFAKCVCDIPKPLSDEEILEYADVFSLDKSPLYEFTDKGLVLFIRAIEERHGIK